MTTTAYRNPNAAQSENKSSLFLGASAPEPKPRPVYECEICGTRFVVYSNDPTYRAAEDRRICGAQACLVEFCRREARELPLNCTCPQRSYPHEIFVHHDLRRESYNPNLKHRWPWSLALLESGVAA